MLRNIGKQSGESVKSVLKKAAGKGLQKRKVFGLEWKSVKPMDGESGESMETMGEWDSHAKLLQQNFLSSFIGYNDELSSTRV